MTAWWPRRRVTHASPGIPPGTAATAWREPAGGVGQTPADLGQTPAGPGQTPAGPGQTPADLGQTSTDVRQPQANLGQPPADAGQTPADAGQTPAGAGQPAETARARGAEGVAGDQRVISLRLEHLGELFNPPQTDLFNHDRRYYYATGIDYAISELRRWPYSRRPVRLEISVPAAELTAGGDQAVARAVRSYCEVRIRYNHSERRGALGDGVASLRVGVPVAAIGITLATISPSGIVGTVLGAVLTWVGLWYPLDQLLFYPWERTRENRSLRLLADAQVQVVPRAATGVEGQSR